QTLADLAADMRLPVVLVVGMRLGCLNHALLSVEAIQSRDVRLLGWVANQIDPAMQAYQENVETLVARIPAPLLGEIPYQENPDPLKIMSYLRFPWEGTTDQ
ncbi:MAG: ATP-dependent dethiobiotin synthetase BioD, partial [bacterium]